jgi:hypothetical protein
MFTFDEKRTVQLRRELSAKLNRAVTQEEVAHEVSARLVKQGEKPIGKQVIRRMEARPLQRIDVPTLNALASFYRSYGLDVSTLVRYVEDDAEEGHDKKVAPRYAHA